MRRLKRVKVYIRGEELLLTPKQLFIKLRKLNFWDMEEFLENNSTDLFNDFTFKLKIIEEIENIHDQLESVISIGLDDQPCLSLSFSDIYLILTIF